MVLPTNPQAVEAVHELVASLLNDGVSQREIAEACRVDPERLGRWMAQAKRQVLADAYMADRQMRIDTAINKEQEWWERIGRKRAEKAAAHTAKCRDRAVSRWEMGYANEEGHTFPHIVDEIVDLYLAGGVTLKQLGEKYGLSPGRIRQLIARDQRTHDPDGVM
jgi:transposase-like protein